MYIYLEIKLARSISLAVRRLVSYRALSRNLSNGWADDDALAWTGSKKGRERRRTTVMDGGAGGRGGGRRMSFGVG